MSKEQVKVEIPGVRAEEGLNLCDDDFDIYLRSLHLFVTNVPETLIKMSAVTSETLHDYSVRAHGIKGISQYIGAEDVRIKAKKLEQMSKDGDFSGFTIHFNPRFMLEALQKTYCDEIKISFEGNLNPFKITPVEDNGEFIFIIVPIRSS